MNIAFIIPENLPLPAVKGGAVESLVDSISHEMIAEYENINIFHYSIFDKKVEKNKNFKSKYKITNNYVSISKYFIKIFANRFFWNSKFYAFFYLLSIIRLIRSSKISLDIIYIHNRPQFVILLKKFFPNSKIYLHIHNEYLHTNSSRPLRKKFINEILEITENVICVSDFISDSIRSNFPKYEYKIKTILNGIDLKRFLNIKNKRDEYRNEFNLKQDTFICLFSGRLVEEKGPHILLETAISILEDGYDIEFIFIGGGFFFGESKSNYIKVMIEKARKYNSIKFLGFLPYDIVHKYYAISDLLIFPSIWEDPSPLVIYEAVCSDLNIISTKSGGVPEIIKNYNKITWVEKGSIMNLKNEILNIYKQDIDYKYFDPQHLSIERMTNEIAQLWRLRKM